MRLRLLLILPLGFVTLLTAEVTPNFEALDDLVQNDPAGAREQLETLLKANGSLSAEEEVRLHLLAARTARMQTDHESGLEFAGRALELAQKDNLSELELEARHEQAIQHHLMGEDNRAIGILNAAVAMAAFMEKPLLHARLLNTLGVIEWKSGALEPALSDLEKSLELRQAHDADLEDIASNYNNIGIVHYALGNLGKARDYHRKSLEMRRAAGNRAGIAASLSNLGEVFNAMGDQARARELMLESLEIEREIGNPTTIAFTLFNLGEVSSALGDYKTAHEFYAECLEIQKRHNLEWGLSLTLLHMAHDANDQRDYDQALQLLQEGKTVAQRLMARAQLADYAKELQRAHAGLGDARLADFFRLEAERLRAESEAALAQAQRRNPVAPASDTPHPEEPEGTTVRAGPVLPEAGSAEGSPLRAEPAGANFISFFDLTLLCLLLVTVGLLLLSNRNLRSQLNEIRAQAAEREDR